MRQRGAIRPRHPLGQGQRLLGPGPDLAADRRHGDVLGHLQPDPGSGLQHVLELEHVRLGRRSARDVLHPRDPVQLDPEHQHLELPGRPVVLRRHDFPDQLSLQQDRRWQQIHRHGVHRRLLQLVPLPIRRPHRTARWNQLDRGQQLDRLRKRKHPDGAQPDGPTGPVPILRRAHGPP